MPSEMEVAPLKEHSFTINRRSDTGFGIWDLARKLATKAKFGPFGQNQDFLGPF